MPQSSDIRGFFTAAGSMTFCPALHCTVLPSAEVELFGLTVIQSYSVPTFLSTCILPGRELNLLVNKQERASANIRTAKVEKFHPSAVKSI